MNVVVMVTENGEQHGLVNVVANSCVDNGFKHMDAKTKSKCEKEKAEDHRKVKARYINHRGNHERLDKVYCRWAGDPIEQWHLIPGYVYELPMGFIKEINEPLHKLQQRSGLMKKDGTVLTKDQPADRIHELVPVSF